MLLRPSRALLVVGLSLGLFLLIWPAREMRSDNFILYLPDNTHRIIPLEAVGRANYLPLLQVLNLVGRVNGLNASENSLKIWFETTQIEVQSNKKKVLINQSSLSLNEPVRVDEGRWIVPLEFVPLVLPRILHQKVEYEAGANRLFIGDVKPSTYTVRLEPEANGARLTIEFTDQVTVHSAVTNGKWLMLLEGPPVEPLEPKVTFQNRFLRDLKFDDQDGVPKLILTPAAEGLNFYMTEGADGKSVRADILTQPIAMAGQTSQQPANPQSSAAAPSAGGAGPPAVTGPPLPTVVLDAGHGGADMGARGMNGVLEKDLVEQLVLRVREALLSTGKYHVVETRLGDADPDFDQRDTIANTARPDAFLTFHAGNLGPGTPRIAVYTYQPSSPPVAGNNPNLFIPWSEVQESHLALSQRLAQGLDQQFEQLAGANVSKPIGAPVRALRSVDAPAVAIEIGSLTPTTDPSALTSFNFQQQLANAILQALNAALRGKS